MDKALKSPRNYLIVSLAFTDLLVGLVVMPVQSILKIKLPGGWVFGVFLCEFYWFLELTVIHASMQHLVMIAIDRLWSLRDVGYFYKRTHFATKIMIFIAWMLAAGAALPFFFYKDDDFVRRVKDDKHCIFSLDPKFVLTASIISFWIPLLIILVLYGNIFWVRFSSFIHSSFP